MHHVTTVTRIVVRMLMVVSHVTSLCSSISEQHPQEHTFTVVKITKNFIQLNPHLLQTIFIEACSHQGPRFTEACDYIY
jgi:hypothetical protein